MRKAKKMDQPKKCDTCLYSDRSGQNEPCHTCLINPIRYTKWVERNEDEKRNIETH